MHNVTTSLSWPIHLSRTFDRLKCWHICHLDPDTIYHLSIRIIIDNGSCQVLSQYNILYSVRIYCHQSMTLIRYNFYGRIAIENNNYFDNEVSSDDCGMRSDWGETLARNLSHCLGVCQEPASPRDTRVISVVDVLASLETSNEHSLGCMKLSVLLFIVWYFVLRTSLFSRKYRLLELS